MILYGEELYKGGRVRENEQQTKRSRVRYLAKTNRKTILFFSTVCDTTF
jgi:hypothetical protein